MRCDAAGEEEVPPYTGPFVTLRPVGLTYSVAIEPRLPTGDGEPRSFDCKHTAWGAARDLWQRHRLPFRDLTVFQTSRAEAEE